MMTNIKQEKTDNLRTLYLNHLQQKWNAEIERAIDRVKNPRTPWDKWFRKEWHRAKWRRIHDESRVARKRATRHQDGLARRSENDR